MANRIVCLIEDITSEYLKNNDLMLWDCEFVKEGRDWFLRIYIDRTDGEYVSTDDCERVSQFISEVLYERDPIEQNYYLEVSSPGMDRELIKPEHFKVCLGQEVEVKTYVPVRAEAKLTEEEGVLDISSFKLKEFNATLLEYHSKDDPDAEEEAADKNSEEYVLLRTIIDTKANNRKPGSRVSPAALKECEIKLSLRDIAKINLAVVFE